MSNREIKYQVWDRQKKTMHQVIDLSFGAEGEGKTIIAYGYDKDRFQGKTLLLVEGESGDLRQFTGLLDKNGKELYEGDVVQFPWDESANIGPLQTREVVNFEDGCFYPHSSAYECEVIGNIYENPELLTSHSH